MTFITRFAPSPTGYLHLGHAFSALEVQKAAKEVGGKVFLRIEDTDFTRCKPEFEDAIYDDLHWLGFEWMPPVLRQSDRLARYEQDLQKLIEKGFVYRCFRSRKEIEEITRAPHGAFPPPYVGAPLSIDEETSRLAAGQAFSWRLHSEKIRDHLGRAFQSLSYREQLPNGHIVERPARLDQYGDIILARKDIGTSYHLASVHDDIATNVTHIIRGEDLRESAGLHRLLYILFDHEPPLYQHHRLLTDDYGKKFSKRDQSLTIRSLRDAGQSPTEVIAMMEAYLR